MGQVAPARPSKRSDRGSRQSRPTGRAEGDPTSDGGGQRTNRYLRRRDSRQATNPGASLTLGMIKAEAQRHRAQAAADAAETPACIESSFADHFYTTRISNVTPAAIEARQPRRRKPPPAKVCNHPRSPCVFAARQPVQRQRRRARTTQGN